MVSQELIDNLLKRAKGYIEEEITVEYIINDKGEKRPTKEKCVQKAYPPDMSALKLYLELIAESENITELSDEALEKEKSRLLKELSKVNALF